MSLNGARAGERRLSDRTLPGVKGSRPVGDCNVLLIPALVAIAGLMALFLIWVVGIARRCTRQGVQV